MTDILAGTGSGKLEPRVPVEATEDDLIPLQPEARNWKKQEAVVSIDTGWKFNLFMEKGPREYQSFSGPWKPHTVQSLYSLPSRVEVSRSKGLRSWVHMELGLVLGCITSSVILAKWHNSNCFLCKSGWKSFTRGPLNKWKESNIAKWSRSSTK